MGVVNGTPLDGLCPKWRLAASGERQTIRRFYGQRGGSLREIMKTEDFQDAGLRPCMPIIHFGLESEQLLARAEWRDLGQSHKSNNLNKCTMCKMKKVGKTKKEGDLWQ